MRRAHFAETFCLINQRVHFELQFQAFGRVRLSANPRGANTPVWAGCMSSVSLMPIINLRETTLRVLQESSPAYISKLSLSLSLSGKWELLFV